MIPTSIIFLHNKRQKHFKVTCFALICLLFMQSLFAAEESYVSNQYRQEVTAPSIEKPVIDNTANQSCDTLVQCADQDTCSDCHLNCCTCCAGTLLSFETVLNKVKLLALAFSDNKLVRSSNPYYSLLRPPKL